MLWLAQNSSTQAGETNPDVVQIAINRLQFVRDSGGGRTARELADAHRPCDAECLNNNNEAAAAWPAVGPGLVPVDVAASLPKVTA